MIFKQRLGRIKERKKIALIFCYMTSLDWLQAVVKYIVSKLKLINCHLFDDNVIFIIMLTLIYFDLFVEKNKRIELN